MPAELPLQAQDQSSLHN